jgi:hypothetical protein
MQKDKLQIHNKKFNKYEIDVKIIQLSLYKRQ